MIRNSISEYDPTFWIEVVKLEIQVYKFVARVEQLADLLSTEVRDQISAEVDLKDWMHFAKMVYHATDLELFHLVIGQRQIFKHELFAPQHLLEFAVKFLA